MTWRSVVGVVTVLFLLALASCSRLGREMVFVVDAHRFAVPEDVILPSRVAWLPWPKREDGFIFFIDPERPIEQRHVALLESRKITCRPDKLGLSSMLAAACNTASVPTLPTANLRKEHQFQGNDAFWEYTAEDNAGHRYPVAVCRAISQNGSAGSCSAFGRYSSLVYSFHFDDSDIGNLSDIRARIESLLSSWERT